jgi:WD40 repeat protein
VAVVFFHRSLTCAYNVLVDDAAVKLRDLYIYSLCFSPDRKFLVTCAEDKQIWVSLMHGG